MFCVVFEVLTIWPPCVADADILFYPWFLLLLLLLFLVYSQRSQIGCLPYSTHDVALVRI